jgi:hypothetical protein
MLEASPVTVLGQQPCSRAAQAGSAGVVPVVGPSPVLGAALARYVAADAAVAEAWGDGQARLATFTQQQRLRRAAREVGERAQVKLNGGVSACGRVNDFACVCVCVCVCVTWSMCSC